MLNRSLRRVVQNCPVTASIPPISQTPARLALRTHQRRHSSSKPPVPPNNGSQSISASVKTVGTAEKRPAATPRPSRRKTAKDKPEADEWTRHLPSVPSTQHLSEKDVSLASFFSTHRPTSITSPLPPQISSEEFDKIFEQRPKGVRSKPAPEDVIYTLSSVVQNLDEGISNQQQPTSQQEQGIRQRADLISALTQQNNEISNTSPGNENQSRQRRAANGVKIIIQELTHRFRPYNPPPVPEPLSYDATGARNIKHASESEQLEEGQARALEIQIESQDSEHAENIHIQTVVLDSNAQQVPQDAFFTSYTVDTPPSATIQDPETSPFEQHTEQDHYEEAVDGNEDPEGRSHQRLPYLDRRRLLFQEDMHAISVKRIRKLKMKKHKHRKLMRRTRHERKKLNK